MKEIGRSRACAVREHYGPTFLHTSSWMQCSSCILIEQRHYKTVMSSYMGLPNALYEEGL